MSLALVCGASAAVAKSIDCVDAIAAHNSAVSIVLTLISPPSPLLFFDVRLQND
jgi:hypothetical protein